MQNAASTLGNNAGNLINTLKSNIITLFLFDKLGHRNATGGTTAFSRRSVLFLVQLLEFMLAHANTTMDLLLKPVNKQSKPSEELLQGVVVDMGSHSFKKSASITVTVNIADHDNLVGQALLDFITSSPKTQHISYKRQNFILNQKDIIEVGDDLYVKMTEATASENGSETSLQNVTGNGRNDIVQVIELFSVSKTSAQLREFLDQLRRNFVASLKNKLGKARYYFNMNPSTAPVNMDGKKDLTRLPNAFAFTMKPFSTNRKFTNLFGEEIDVIRARVQHFCKNRAWYDEKGIPYTLGLLLSGPPGTGKTSTIKCLANETNRHIISINLNNDMTKLQLENLFYNENMVVVAEGQTQTVCIPLDQRVYVLEDVDAQSDIVSVAKRSSDTCLAEKKPPSCKFKEGLCRNYNEEFNHAQLQQQTGDIGEHLKVDLAFLLNLLDGILENPGRVVIMTSNYPEKLDSALVRPGRIDIIAKFRYCTHSTIRQMVEFFYDRILEGDQEAIVAALPEDVFTPAELSRIMFEYFTNIDGALTAMQHYSVTASADSKMVFVQDQSSLQEEEETRLWSPDSDMRDLQRLQSTSSVTFNESFIDNAPFYEGFSPIDSAYGGGFSAKM